MIVMERGGRDQKVVWANHLPTRLQCCPDPGVLAGQREVELDRLDLGQDQFDEPGARLLPSLRLGAFDAVQEFSSGDGGDAKSLLFVRGEQGMEVQSLPLCGNQNGCIEDHSHLETRGPRRVRESAMSRSKLAASSGPSIGRFGQSAANSRPVLGRQAGLSLTIGLPPLTRIVVPPWGWSRLTHSEKFRGAWGTAIC